MHKLHSKWSLSEVNQYTWFNEDNKKLRDKHMILFEHQHPRLHLTQFVLFITTDQWVVSIILCYVLMADCRYILANCTCSFIYRQCIIGAASHNWFSIRNNECYIAQCKFTCISCQAKLTIYAFPLIIPIHVLLDQIKWYPSPLWSYPGIVCYCLYIYHQNKLN